MRFHEDEPGVDGRRISSSLRHSWEPGSNRRTGLMIFDSKYIHVPLLYAAGAAALAFTGPGQYSLDALLGVTSMWTTRHAEIAVGLAALGAIASLTVRQSAVPSRVHA